MDTLPSDLQEVAKLSSNDIVSKELNNEEMMNPLDAPPIGSAGASGGVKKKRKSKAVGGRPSAQVMRRRSSNLVAETVWTKFKNQLSRLMDTLSLTKTRYIRCIKPNQEKLPNVMEHVSTVDQLRCAGVVAAVTISRSAFPNRLEHLLVLERFKSLWPRGDHNRILQDMTLDPEQRVYKAVEVLLTVALKDREFEKQNLKFRAFVMGKTRAYFRAGALEFLEGERIKYLGKFATVLQTQVRGYLLRQKYKGFLHATLKLQCYHRQRMQRMRYQKLKMAAIKVQCWHRILHAARTIVHLRRTLKATMIQTQWRIRRDSRRFQKVRSATIVIQTCMRGSIQRPKYRQALIDKKEEAKLENQLRALQRKLEEAEAKRLEAEKHAEEKAAEAIEKYKTKEEEEKKAKEEEEQEQEQNSKDEASKEQAAPAPAHEATVSNEADVIEADVVDEDTRKKEHDLEMEEKQNEMQELTEEQQKLMDESGKMLEYLRKEVFKLRGQNQQLKTDFDLLKDNNQRLMDANASAGASFAALNQHAKQLSKQNAQLVGDVTTMKGQVQKLNILQVELKEELKLKQASYIGEVQSRLQYQKAVQRITDMITDQCRDHRLVERVLEVTDECEMEFMSAGAAGGVASPREGYAMGDGADGYSNGNTPGGPMDESRGSIFGFLNPFS